MQTRAISRRHNEVLDTQEPSASNPFAKGQVKHLGLDSELLQLPSNLVLRGRKRENTSAPLSAREQNEGFRLFFPSWGFVIPYDQGDKIEALADDCIVSWIMHAGFLCHYVFSVFVLLSLTKKSSTARTLTLHDQPSMQKSPEPIGRASASGENVKCQMDSPSLSRNHYFVSWLKI